MRSLLSMLRTADLTVVDWHGYNLIITTAAGLGGDS
jgi:hypothetical protein